MAGSSISTLIIFIAAISIAAGVSGVMVQTIGDISNSIAIEGDSVEQQLDADITIISDPGSDAIHNSGNVSILIKNTGSVALSTDESQTDILVDGSFVQSSSTTIVVKSSGSNWRPGEVVEATVNLNSSLSSGRHRVSVIVDGDQEVIRFFL